MDLDEAAANFVRSTTHCDNLIAVHRRSGGDKAGKRDEEISVNRAIVVLTVGAWQAVIQDFTRACLDLGTPGPGDTVSLPRGGPKPDSRQNHPSLTMPRCSSSSPSWSARRRFEVPGPGVAD